jgi:hypothetical protein
MMGGEVTGDDVSEAVDNARDRGDLAGTDFGLPEPSDDGADAEEGYCERES